MFVIYKILKANTQNKSYEQLEHPAGTHFFPENAHGLPNLIVSVKTVPPAQIRF